MSAVRCGVAAFLVDVFGISTNAWGNDLSAARWVMIADVPHGRAAALLQALGTAGVPARAARIRQRSLRGVDTRVWVDSDRLSRAEKVLLAELAAGGSIACAASRVSPAVVHGDGG
jgi:hypothetical protein